MINEPARWCRGNHDGHRMRMRPLAIQGDFAYFSYLCDYWDNTVRGGANFKGLFYGWLPRRWISGVPASTLAAVLATVLAAIRGELRDLWDPAGEHRLHTHNHPLPSEQTPNLNLFYFCFFFFLSFCAFATSWSLITSDRTP